MLLSPFDLYVYILFVCIYILCLFVCMYYFMANLTCLES